MTEEEMEIIEEANITPADEAPEQIQARLAIAEYRRRNEQAIREREEIFRRNGLLKPGESLTMDIEAAVRQRCCF